MRTVFKSQNYSIKQFAIDGGKLYVWFSNDEIVEVDLEKPPVAVEKNKTIDLNVKR